MSINHQLRAEIEEFRQKLMESDQILEQHRKVLEGEITKNQLLKKEIHRMKLIESYGYDDDNRDISELEERMQDMKMLLEEKNMTLAAQKDINKKLMLQLKEMIDKQQQNQE